MKLNRFRRDALQEIGNMGASHAANSLSSMLGVKVEIQVPEFDTLPVNRLEALAGEGGGVIGVYSQLLESLSGTMLLLFPLRDGQNLAKILTGGEEGPDESGLSEVEISAVQEVGNIMMSSFANALSDFLGLKIMLTPSITVRGSLASIVHTVFEEPSAEAIFFTTAFSASPAEVRGHLVLLPDPDASERIFASIGKRYGLTED